MEKMQMIKAHQKRVKAARDRKSSIPGPEEAKECTLKMEKKHLIDRKLKLWVFPPLAALWRLRVFPVSCRIY